MTNPCLFQQFDVMDNSLPEFSLFFQVILIWAVSQPESVDLVGI